MADLVITLRDAHEALERGDFHAALAGYHALVYADIPVRAKSICWLNAGWCYEQLGYDDASCRAYHWALCLDVNNAQALNNRGSLIAAQHRPDEAEPFFVQALTNKPDFPAAINGLSTCAVHRGDYALGVRYAEQALQLDSGYFAAEWNLSLAELALGKWAEGWQHHQARKLLPRVARSLPVPATRQWKGEPLAGKRIVVLSEQGFGDCLQWSRLLQHLHYECGATVILETYDPLMNLMIEQPYVHEVCRRTGAFPDHDLWTFLLDIPGIIGWTPETDTVRHPILSVGEVETTNAVGIAWQGRQSHGNNANRSIPTEVAERIIASCPDVEWVALSPTDTLKGAEDVREHMKDFWMSAQLFASLRAVVSIDSGPLHLAGCLGVPVLGLMPHVTEWRWHTGYQWYPSMSMAVQTSPGDWESMLPSIRRFVSAKSLVAA